MSSFKISCLSIDCPERQGGICRWDPRTPYGKRSPHFNAWQQAWEEVQGIIAEFGDTDPEDCLAILTEHVDKALHGKKEFEQ